MLDLSEKEKLSFLKTIIKYLIAKKNNISKSRFRVWQLESKKLK